MISGSSDPARTRAAIVLSLVLHGLGLAAFFAVGFGTVAMPLPSDREEPAVLPVMLRIEHRVAQRLVAAAPHALPVVPAPPPPSQPVPRAIVPARIALAATAHHARAAEDRKRVEHAPDAVHERAAPVTTADAPPAPAVTVAAPAQQAALVTVQTPAAATPAPAPPVRTAEIASAAMGPPGANYKPTLLPAGSETTLRSAAGSHFRVLVTVDERGHAVGLKWLLSIADDAVRERIAAQLLAARYVPAECDGLPCTDTYDLRN